MDVLITTNSPGELWSWVRVTVGALRERRPEARIVVALVPCQYASGAEPEVARGIPGVDLVLPPGVTFRLLLGLGAREYRPAREGVVVFMGGDMWHATRLARRFGFPSVAYTPHARSACRRFDTVAVADEPLRDRLVARGVDPARIRCVGDLMVDGVTFRTDPLEARRELGIPPEAPVLGLFPGSRRMHLRAALPIFLAAAEQVVLRVPDARCLLALSPFVTPEEAQRALDRPLDLGVTRCTGRFEAGRLLTQGGLEVAVARGRPNLAVAALDAALTIPGTNTAELACAGRPMVLALSARAPVSLDGLRGILNMLPLGRWKDRLRLKEYWKFRRLVAQPNIRAGRQVVPEVFLEAGVAPVVEPLVELLGNPARRDQLASELRALMGPAGASGRLAELICQTARPKGETVYA
ncbi:MAG: hypothetical protein AB1758_18935 [Candidatus Eremiobacterota bacterium]